MKTNAPHWTEGQFLAHQRKHGFTTDSSVFEKQAAIALKRQQTKLRLSRKPNNTEEDFRRILEARRLKGEFLTVEFEAVRLRIGDGSYYTPDFLCQTTFGRPACFEVKGAHKWEDSIVKYKAAKERHAWADFEIWEKRDGRWSQIG